MPRPRLFRRVSFHPNVTYFKPAGIRMVELQETVLTVDEFEALRLKDFLGLEQEEAAKKMEISQPTFHRLILAARNKVSDAIVNGKALRIEGGTFQIIGKPERIFLCLDCRNRWSRPHGIGRPEMCPKCQSKNFYRQSRNKGFGKRQRGWR